MSSREVLSRYFGFSEFRSHQEQVIDTALAGGDALVVMPTGGGKSICYQVPALMKEGLTVVVSPLIALMKDQVDSLRENGIAAAYLNSGLSPSQQEQVIQQLHRKELKLLYLAPERLSGKDFQFLEELKSLNVALFAVDEAHCISHWGPDFRPDYLVLGRLKQYFPNVPVMALTASADSLTRNDIIEQLQLKKPDTYIASFNRPNLAWMVELKHNAREKLLQFLENKKEDSGIIYCMSRSSTEELAQFLKDRGFNAGYYHAGLSSELRNDIQDQFSKDKLQIIVATIAFGMGIDKSNVRFVIHMDLPKNIESYYQETGRAGRDGLLSQAILYYSAGDVSKLKNMINKDAVPEQQELMLRKLQQMAQFAEVRQCRRQYLMNYFGEAHPDNCGNCDYCMSDIVRYDATIDTQKVMSAVIRLKERFGVNLVIDFLKGSQSKKILDYMKELKTYGVGKDKSSDEWQFIIRQLIQRKLLDLSEGQYQVLKVGENSKAILIGEQQVMLEAYKQPVKVVSEVRTLDTDSGLFTHLKHVRLSLAEVQGVPAFTVLSDASLAELAYYRPFQKEELFHISGFGQFKVEKYGDTFITAIQQYCQERQMTSIRIEKVNIKPKATSNNTLSPTSEVSYRLFRSGRSISEIAEERKFAKSTIFNHLTPYIELGQIQMSELVSHEKITQIKEAINIHGANQGLKVLKEALDESISYDEIRIVIAGSNAVSHSAD